MNNHLINYLSRIRWMLWLRNIIQGVLVVGFYAAIIVGILVILDKFGGLPRLGGPAAGMIFYLSGLGTGLAIGLVIGLAHRPSLHLTALFLDKIFNLHNRLTTTLEIIYRSQAEIAGRHSESVPTADPPKAWLEDLLVSESKETITRLPAFRPVHWLNQGYVFRFAFTMLVVIFIWLLPLNVTPAVISLNKITTEEAAKLQNTARNIPTDQQIDTATRKVINDLDTFARALTAHELPPEEIIKQLQDLEQKTRNELNLVDNSGRLVQTIALTLNRPLDETTSGDATQINQLLDDLENAIREGRVTVDVLGQLKELLKDIKQTAPNQPEVTNLIDEAISALDTPAAKISEPLKKFFEAVSRKNREVLEQILTRLEITQEEVQRGLARYYPQTGIVQPSVPPTTTAFSRASDGGSYPHHPGTAGPSPDIGIPLPIINDPAKAGLIKEVIKNREAALRAPTWPTEYDEIIRAYFTDH